MSAGTYDLSGDFMTSRPCRALAAVLLTLLSLGQAGPAGAQSILEHDAHGDVRSFTGAAETTTPEPTVADGDILMVRLTHGRYRVGVRIKLVDLQKTGDYRGHVVQVVTNEGVHRDVVLSAGPQLWRGVAEMDRPSGRKVRCAVRHSIDYTNHVVTIGFPRSCVSNPRWVRLGAASFTVTGQRGHVDDSLLANRVDENTIALSSRLERG